MKKSIFITGIAGSGKSTISQELSKLGYEAYDIEDDAYGLFMMIRKDTGEPYVDYDNSDITKVNNARWICDLDKLQVFINKQNKELAFYFGIASDNEKLIPLFDESILLQVSPEVLDSRLLTREGTDNFANTKAGRKRVLSWKDEFEEKMIKLGMIPINANPDSKKVTKEIVDLVTSV